MKEEYVLIGKIWIDNKDSEYTKGNGDVEGVFNDQLLKMYIERHGINKLLEHLAHMSKQVLDMEMSIRDEQNIKKA